MEAKDTIYEEGFVKHTPYYHKEVTSIIPGEAGEPISHSITNDGFVAMALTLSILLSIIMTARSWRFISFQTKNLFRMPREHSVELRETSDEMQYQLFFAIQGIALLATFAYNVTQEYIDRDIDISEYALLGLYFGVFAAYRIITEILHHIVHLVFFTKAQRHLSNISRLFLIAMQGALMLPLLLLNVYLDTDAKLTLHLLVIMVAVTLLLRFYKAFCIFFRKNNNFLQFFLYLCTLEAVPLAILTGILITIANFLKVNI